MMPNHNYTYFIQAYPLFFAIIVSIIVLLIGLALFMALTHEKKYRQSTKKPLKQKQLGHGKPKQS